MGSCLPCLLFIAVVTLRSLALRLLFIAGVFVVHCWGDPEGSCLPCLLFTAGVILRDLSSSVCCLLLG